MKGSTLHRSGLTREKMGVLASLSQTDKKAHTKNQLNHYYRNAKSKELDLLWGGVQRGMQKVHSVTKTNAQKSPMAYLTIGFIAGVLFMCCVTFAISIFSMTPKTEPIEDTKTNVAVIGTDTVSETTPEVVSTNEKYVVKQGDTLNGIAYRFYGKYDEEKILEIQRINNITNPQAIRIGQELQIPVSR